MTSSSRILDDPMLLAAEKFDEYAKHMEAGISEHDESVVVATFSGARSAYRRCAEYCRAQPSGQWAPIDSAPKDGTRVLLGWFLEGGGGGDPEVGFWHGAHKKWCGRVLLNADGYFSPTHWMPLPPPPPEQETP